MSDFDTKRPKKPVGIWIRVSTGQQAAGDSPATHEHRALGYAAAKEWDVVETYRLTAVSGKNVREHPECRRMMEDVKAGRIQALVFSKLARLARNARDLIDFEDFFREHDCAMVSLHESYDTSTHTGRLFYNMLASLAQWEREEISSRVKEAMATRAKMGKSLGGAAPYGYKWQDGVLALEPIEAAVRARMYELFNQTQRMKAVARTLNDEGLRTRRGKPWRDSTIRDLLMDTTSKGIRRTNYSYIDPKTQRMALKPESEWIWLEVPSLVSEEVWEQANSVLAKRNEKRKLRPGRTSKHLFTGLVCCADCGKKIYVHTRGTKYYCNPCAVGIATDDLEAIFLEKLREWLTPETVASILLQADQLLQEKKRLAESLDEQIKGVASQMDQLFELNAKGEVPTKGFGLRYQPLEERQEQLQIQRARVQGEIDSHQVELISEEQALSEADQLLKGLEQLDPELKRLTVQTLVREIRVGKEEVVLKLNYLPFPSLSAPKRHGNVRATPRS